MTRERYRIVNEMTFSRRIHLRALFARDITPSRRPRRRRRPSRCDRAKSHYEPHDGLRPLLRDVLFFFSPIPLPLHFASP